LLDDSYQSTSEHAQENAERVKNWDSETLLDFQKNINQERINNLIIELSRPGDDMTPGSVNSIVENIGKIFVESAKITFCTFCSTKSRPRQKKSEDKPWFSVECKLARQNYRKLRRKYKKNRTEKNKEELNNSEEYYKTTLDKNQKLYRNKITKQLRNLRTNNPKEYWKIPNSGRHRKQQNISITNLLQFLKKLNGAPSNFDEIDMSFLNDDMMNGQNYNLNSTSKKTNL
jgi:hypothetical protein